MAAGRGRGVGGRLLPWAGPVLLAVELALVVTGRLSLGAAAGVFVALEAVLALLTAGQVVAGVRRYRAERGTGADPGQALEVALRSVLPAPVAFVVRNEAQLVASMVLLLRRRRHGVPPGAVPISYDRALRPMGLLMLGVAIVELLVVELVLPWPSARLVLLILSVYTLVVVLGIVASNTVRPHVVTADTLRLRAGSWADVRVPLDAVADARARLGDAPNRSVAVVGDALVMGVAGATTVEVRLRDEVLLDLGRRSAVVSTVRFAADDPAAAVLALAARQRSTAQPAPGLAPTRRHP